MAHRIILVLFGLCLATLTLEVGFRARTYILEGSGASLEARLKKSAGGASQEIQAGSNLSGIIEPSKFADIVYELRPGIFGTFQGKPFTFNSRGVRDKEYRVEKPQGTYRIVGIGDSVMFGWGVDEQDSYLAQVERTLKQRCENERRYEVINMAVPGYNTSMEVATLAHKGLDFNPDLVVLHFVSNDLSVPLFMQPPHNVLELSKSYVWEFLRERLAGEQQSSRQLLGIDFRGVKNSEKQRVLEKYSDMAGAQGFKNAMTRLADITSPREIPVVVIMGHATKALRKLVRSESVRHGFHLVNVKPFVEAYVARHNITNTKSGRATALQVSRADPHPNPRGHEIYAEALLENIGMKKGCAVALSNASRQHAPMHQAQHARRAKRQR